MSLRESAQEEIVRNRPDIIPSKGTKSPNVGLPRSTSMDSIDSGLGPSRAPSVLSLNSGPSRASSVLSINEYDDRISAPMENLKLDLSSDSSSVSSTTTLKTTVENNRAQANQKYPSVVDSNSQHDCEKIEKSIVETNQDKVQGSGRSVTRTSNQVDTKSRSARISESRIRRQFTIMIPEEPPIPGKKIILT